jgi:hypothetical protein
MAHNDSSTPSVPTASTCGLARLALGLSIFAFIPPFGIAAVVLGHIAENRIEASGGSLNGGAKARAALWIAYLQLAVFSIVGVILWNIVHDTAEGFRRDAAVQRVFREYDDTRPLDPESAHEAELAAQSAMYQLIAIEDQIKKQREDGSYVCQVYGLLENGPAGATDAEKRAFAMRVQQSPYLFDIVNCQPEQYTLTAVPRTPRMPEHSAIFCSNETGAIRVSRGRTSVDCLQNGEPVR